MHSCNSINTVRFKKPSPSTTIAFAIKAQDGEMTYYKASEKKTTKNVLKSYCHKKNFKLNEVVFFNDDFRIRPDKTLAENGVKEGGVIEALVHQTGGGYSTT